MKLVLFMTLILGATLPALSKGPLSIDSSLEVADPGLEGEKTLLGIDKDNNGVRDDIQRYINETYPNRDSTKKALAQMAKAMNLSLKNADDKQLSNEHAHGIGDAITCLMWIDDENSIKIERLLRKKFYNTPERIQTKLKVGSNFHGQGLGPRAKGLKPNQWNQLCDFPAVKNN